MRRFFSAVFTLAGKDLKIELRSKEGIFSTLLFVILVLFIFNFGFGAQPDTVQKAAPGILWIVIALSGTIALSHLARREAEDGVQEGMLLTGLGGGTLFFAKFAAAMVFMSLIEAVTIPLFIVLYNFPGGWVLPFLPILVLGTAGYAAVGIFLATLLNRSHLKDLLLPIAFYPVLIPWFIAAMKATADVMEGNAPTLIPFFLGFDIIFLTASALLFGFVLEDLS